MPRGNNTNELSVTLDAGSTLTGGDYRWRVYALDGRGAASTDSALSVSGFKYVKTDEGTINISTIERIGGRDLPVGYVELRLEVVSGPTMKPLLFYTSGEGTQGRSFPVGTYRITTVKEGYTAYTATVTVSRGATADVTIPMSRPEAVLYGRVLADGGLAVGAAKVTAVSEWGDTVSVTTDDRGGFTFSGRAADWTITVDKSGFKTSAPKKVTLKLGENNDFVSVNLERSDFALSGVIRNSSGHPVMGARVRILREGVLLDELISTPQNGAYVFYLNAGTYAVTAEKPGFTMFSRSVAVTGTVSQDIILREGAVVVSGAVTGRSWVASVNNYVVAPITSASVTFTDVTPNVSRRDTFTVISDAVFGKFSASLPKDRNYNVTASAVGFAASGNVHDFNTTDVSVDLSKEYNDTLYALATVKGRVTGVAEGAQVDVNVYDANGRTLASKRIITSGRNGGDPYEVRNIPDGNVRIGVGAEGYFTNTAHSVIITKGRLDPNRENYDFSMGVGDKVVKFDVTSGGRGVIKLVSPFNKTLAFDNVYGTSDTIRDVGSGDYVVEAAVDDTNRLALSYRKFNVSDSENEHTEQLSFPFTHKPDSLADTSNGNVRIKWPEPVIMNRLVLYYRSEGSVRFDSVSANGADRPMAFSVKPARDGCKLYYYFRVYHTNNDVYGSSNQLYATHVRANDKLISRVVVEPGVIEGDTLLMSSSYQAAFTLKAFYGDVFVPITGNMGRVSWSVSGAGSGSGTGMTYSYVTPDGGERNLILRAALTPTGGYKMKPGVDSTVNIPIRVTGKRLKSIDISRKGNAGPILNNERIGFRADAFDESLRAVTVSPRWDRYPVGAGEISGDGSFVPNRKFVGMARIAVDVGGRKLEYTEPGAEFPGQRVNYPIKRNATGNDTADTRMGMRVIFGAGTVKEGVNAELGVTVPQLTNYVHRGTENYMMADSVAFDLTFSDTGAIGGNIVLAFDVPQMLKDAVNDGSYEFRVAKWLPDSLRWVPTDSTRVSGGVVYTVLSPMATTGSALPKTKKTTARRVSRASALTKSARYALVIKANKTSLALSVSPHPFSPYIVPVHEYGSGAKAGTCIKVGIQAPDPFVKSVKVRVYNATGKMVWGIEKLNAQTGENRFWWNGRTSGSGGAAVSEDVWSDDYYEKNAGRPMCRNGRYYVAVLLTDMEGKQMRAVKPLVLMK